MRVVILGNGITGVTAALRLRELQPDWSITLVSGESTFHYSRPALMYIYMGHMRYQDAKPFEDSVWEEQRIDLLRDWVTAIDVDRHVLELHRTGTLAFDQLLLATGSKSNRFGWKGQDLQGVQGLYDLMDLRLLGENARQCERAVIVGGGLIGIELAEMLHSQGIAVTFLVREENYWDNVLPKEESQMINRIIREHGFDLRLTTTLDEILDNGQGRVSGVVTGDGERIDCQMVGLTAGVAPNTDLVRGTPIEVGRGILVDRSLRTSVPGILAAGDCAEIRVPEGPRNLIQQVWYTGKAQGRIAGEVLAGEASTYEPGLWYNSAKFLDLEYQVYGSVNLRVPHEQNLFWEHSDHRHAIRVVHVNGVVIGLNFMGLRFRHRVAESWILEERSVDYVFAHLREGNFDPEFFARLEPMAIPALRAQYETQPSEMAR